ncbi:MAG: hypothetical protein HFI75_14540 [Lachnospiraceae bacterium]|nr:hypothetical protein [Lachnospiraceae bacterium]
MKPMKSSAPTKIGTAPRAFNIREYQSDNRIEFGNTNVNREIKSQQISRSD